ncbi:hypothetical protein MFIFM68171_03522 [Madurella fahalii]|uniref:Uncharacterized protein n=1 Tax=Madurella fahalii TaxID=1157608 RepID=A0ABQ0G6C7_9PEZI
MAKQTIEGVFDRNVNISRGIGKFTLESEAASAPSEPYPLCGSSATRDFKLTFAPVEKDGRKYDNYPEFSGWKERFPPDAPQAEGTARLTLAI